MDNNKPVAARCAMTVPVDDQMAGKGFVKGPWELIEKGTTLRVKQKNDGDWYQGLICSFHKPLMDVDYANARLIAAAPDLLEACQSILNDGADWLSDEASTMLKRAIAKATKP